MAIAFRVRPQRSSRHFEADQYSSIADDGNGQFPRMSNGPCVATRAASSSMSRECMTGAGLEGEGASVRKILKSSTFKARDEAWRESLRGPRLSRRDFDIEEGENCKQDAKRRMRMYRDDLDAG